MRYVALLRGINVGKSVQVPMRNLKAQLESMGLLNVKTYLNSGNVIFDTVIGHMKLKEIIADMLEREYGQKISVLIKTSMEILNIRGCIPDDWMNDATQQTYVAYLFDDIADQKLLDELPIKKQYVETIFAYDALIWNIKRENYNRSQITKIVNHKAYERMTTRNVNTARKLAELCQETDN